MLVRLGSTRPFLAWLEVSDDFPIYLMPSLKAARTETDSKCRFSFKKKFLFLIFQQDSSLGSFEGEPVVSDESLPEIGLRAARSDAAGGPSSAAGGGGQTLTSRRSFQQRPVTASIDQVLFENSPGGGSSGNSLSSRQSGRISYGPTSSKTQAQV